jgi:hypothetical protein
MKTTESVCVRAGEVHAVGIWAERLLGVVCCCCLVGCEWAAKTNGAAASRLVEAGVRKTPLAPCRWLFTTATSNLARQYRAATQLPVRSGFRASTSSVHRPWYRCVFAAAAAAARAREKERAVLTRQSHEFALSTSCTPRVFFLLAASWMQPVPEPCHRFPTMSRL